MNYKTIIGLFVLLLAVFLITEPKISSYLFPLKRHETWNTFINQVKKTNYIDPQKFWEFREFYYPGYFTFAKNGLPITQMNKFFTSANIILKSNVSPFPFLMYQADKKLTSLETLVAEDKLDQLIDRFSFQNISVIYSSPTSLIYTRDKNNAVIIFVETENEMLRANGFFDFREKNKAPIAGKHWFVITSVRLD